MMLNFENRVLLYLIRKLSAFQNQSPVQIIELGEKKNQNQTSNCIEISRVCDNLFVVANALRSHVI